MKYPKVSIIIPTHNNIDSLLRCIGSVERLSYPNIEIIIINDGSKDTTNQKIRKHNPKIICLEGDGNLFWTASINLGVKYAIGKGSDYILLLNDDNTIDKNSVSYLVNYAETHPDTIVGSMVYWLSQLQRIRYAGGKTNWLRGYLYPLKFGEIDVDFYREIEPYEVDYFGGQGVLINTKFFNSIGLFDQKNFPHYGADSDFFLRATKMGYKLILLPKSKIWDDISSTGISLRNNSLKLNDFVKSFNSIKSPANIKIKFRFFRKHCPKKIYYIGLLNFYILFTLKFVKIFIKNLFKH